MSTFSTKTRGECFGTQYDVAWFTVFPGAPRTPSSWLLGFAKGPMQLMFWLPKRSIWEAPIITWRRPFQTRSKTDRYGIQASLSERAGARDERRLAVRQQQVGLEGLPRQPRSKRRHEGHRARQHLAVAAERLGARDGAHLGPRSRGPGHRAHDCPQSCTACWYSF